MIADPRFAPKRTDLPWLRRRRLPRGVATTPEQAHGAVADFVSGRASHPASPADHAHEALADFVTGHAAHDAAPASSSQPSQKATQPSPPVRPAAAAPSSLDLDAPVTPPARPAARASSSLDLDAPATPPSRPAAASSSLDLDAPATPPTRPAARASSSLDLDAPAAAAARPAAPKAAARRVRPDERVRAGKRMLLSVAEPTVTLTRLQSAIGALSIEAACSDEVGDLRIGCAYDLVSGASSTVQLTQGSRMGPPGSRRPVLVASHDRFEKVELDLRQSTDVRRLIVYAFSESRAQLQWGGTLIVTTFGGARVELPLESLQSGDCAVLLSLYNVHGEFVLRAEMQTLFGGVREGCRAYGYDRITWLDDRTPVE